jgi:High-temperature-induced dauer-formation protein
MKYNPASWRVPYDHVVWKDPKQILVIYCLQLLLVLLLYPIPEDGRGAPPKNYYRHYYGRLHRPQDFQFLVDGMTKILNQPVSSKSTNWFCFILTLHNRCKPRAPIFLEAKEV